MSDTYYTPTVWTAGDVISEAKMDAMVANDRAVDAMYQGVEFTERADPATPGANKLHLYAKDKSGVPTLYCINDAGTVSELANTDVKARAWNNVAQSIVTNTETKVQLNTESYDIGSDFDNVTNYRFVCPIAGYYMVVGSVGYSALDAGSRFSAQIWKNGGGVTQSYFTSGAATDHVATVSDIIYCVATDYLELYAFHTHPVVNRNTSEYERQTFMAVHLISV